MITAQQARAICDEYQAGTAVKAIYAAFAIHPWELYAALNKHGIARRRAVAPYTPRLKERNAQIQADHKGGIGWDELAARHEISRCRLQQIVRTGR